MNYFKKLSVAALLAFFYSTNSFAESLTVDAPASVTPGATGVLVNINIDTGANTAGASFTVTYDAAKLQYKSVSSSFFATFATQGITTPSSTVTVGSTTYSKGLVDNPTSGKVMLAAAQATNGTAGAKTLFTLTFDAISGVTGSSVIAITPSTITNAAAGYTSATAVPMLVGIGANNTYPAITPTVTNGTLTIQTADSDGDGIADSWEVTYFGTLTTANSSTDTDGDGYSDLNEFLNNTDPKIRNAPGNSGYNKYTDNQATFIGDFDGNKVLDILFRDQATGLVSILFADKSATPVFVGRDDDMNWVIIDTGDFNGDGKSDILWHNKSTGQVYIYLMDGITILSGSGSPGAISDLNYGIETTGDFNGDGKSDILWRNRLGGQIYMWFMNGSATTSQPYVITEPDIDWAIKNTGDFNGDGKSDILLRNQSTGQAYIYLMDGITILSGYGSPGTVSDLNFVVITTGDFNGDSKSDILWWNKSNGQMYIWFMNGSASTSQSYVATQSDNSQLMLGTSDKNSDGKSDIFWLSSNNGQMYYWQMNDHLIEQVVYDISSRLYTDNGGNGFWQWNTGNWSQISTVDPSDVVAHGTLAYAKMADGLYEWNGYNWKRITTDIPTTMLASTSGLYADFAGWGLYNWNGTTWTRITTDHPASMVASTSGLYADFAGWGLYYWNGTAWTRLTPDRPANLVATTSGLYADFAGWGLYYWNGTAWTRLTPDRPANIVATTSGLYADFAGWGLYNWNGTAWTRLTPDHPFEMAPSGPDFYASFTGWGIYKWKGGTNWTRINTATPENITASGSILYATFAGNVQKYELGSWSPLLNTTPVTSMVAGF